MRSAEQGVGDVPDFTQEPLQTEVVENISHVVGILRRRWLLVVVLTLVGVAASAAALAALQPQYRASTTVVLHMSGPRVLDKIKGVTDDADARQSDYREYYETQRTIMRSRVVAERALATVGLAEDPVFLGIADISSEPERLAKLAEIDPVEELREIVQVNPVRNSRAVLITALYPDPEVAAEIANAVADAYLEHVQTSRSRAGTEAKDHLTQERTKAGDTLREAEKALADFKKDNQITTISLDDRQNVITANIMTLSQRAKAAEASRIELKAKYAQAKKLHAAGNIAGSALLDDVEQVLFEQMRRDQVEAEREFARVNVELGPKHPDVRKATARLDLINARVERESKDLLGSLQARLVAAQSTEQQLNAALRAEQDRAMALSLLEREYRELEREATTAAEAYGLVAARDTEIGITNRVESEGIEILDRATVPIIPAYPRKVVVLALGVIGGFLLGAATAIGVDVRDQRIRGALDLERALSAQGLPVLGELPLLPVDPTLGVGNIRAQRRNRDLHTHLHPQSLMAERCRGIRTSLAFAQGDQKAQTLMVTSASSEEGKSATAINLALSFAQTRKRVCLVDADMRRPRLHHVFAETGLRDGIGLSSVLTESCTLEEAVQRAGDELPENLEVMVCGPTPDNPAELLHHTPIFRRVLNELRERYDVVIFDTPPVLPVADPMILAQEVDGVIVVARCQSTTRGEVRRSIELLQQGDTNLIGVVLNQTSTGQGRYGYKAGYYTYEARKTEAEHA